MAEKETAVFFLCSKYPLGIDCSDFRFLTKLILIPSLHPISDGLNLSISCSSNGSSSGQENRCAADQITFFSWQQRIISVGILGRSEKVSSARLRAIPATYKRTFFSPKWYGTFYWNARTGESVLGSRQKLHLPLKKQMPTWSAEQLFLPEYRRSYGHILVIYFDRGGIYLSISPFSFIFLFPVFSTSSHLWMHFFPFRVKPSHRPSLIECVLFIPRGHSLSKKQNRT